MLGAGQTRERRADTSPVSKTEQIRCKTKLKKIINKCWM